MKQILKFIFLIVFVFSSNIPGWGKVMLLGKKKPKLKASRVVIHFKDHSKFRHCEEMGLIYKRDFFTFVHSEKGIINRMQKEAAKVGTTDILVSEFGADGPDSSFWWAYGILYKCPHRPN